MVHVVQRPDIIIKSGHRVSGDQNASLCRKCVRKLKNIGSIQRKLSNFTKEVEDNSTSMRATAEHPW